MGFLDNLGKTLTQGTERVKFEADKFQRTTKINSEIGNVKTQIETNLRQLGERALELYQQGTITAPEIASLAQIIAQLREQQTGKEQELEATQSESFEVVQAVQAAIAPTPTQQVPVMSQSIPVVQATAGPTSCTNCGATIPTGAAFCPECGMRAVAS